MATFKELIEKFVSGEREGASAGQGNLKIKGNRLVHYYTPILERFDGKYLLNNTRYSLVTGRLQKQIREVIPEEKLVIVVKVPEGYQGSLVDFINDKGNV